MNKSFWAIMIRISVLTILIVPILVTASFAMESSVSVDAEQEATSEWIDDTSRLDNENNESSVVQVSSSEEPSINLEQISTDNDRNLSTNVEEQSLARNSGPIISDDTRVEIDLGTTSNERTEAERTSQESQDLSVQVDPTTALTMDQFQTSLRFVTTAGGQEVDEASADTYTFEFGVTNLSGRDIQLNRATIFNSIYLYTPNSWQSFFLNNDYTPEAIRFANGETITETFVLTKEQLKSFSNKSSSIYSLWAVPSIVSDNGYTSLYPVYVQFTVDLSGTEQTTEANIVLENEITALSDADTSDERYVLSSSIIDNLSLADFEASISSKTAKLADEGPVPYTDVYTFDMQVTNRSGQAISIGNKLLYSSVYLYNPSGGLVLTSYSSYYLEEISGTRTIDDNETITEQFQLSRELIANLTNYQSGNYYLCVIPAISVGNRVVELSSLYLSFDIDFTRPAFTTASTDSTSLDQEQFPIVNDDTSVEVDRESADERDDTSDSMDKTVLEDEGTLVGAEVSQEVEVYSRESDSSNEEKLVASNYLQALDEINTDDFETSITFEAPTASIGDARTDSDRYTFKMQVTNHSGKNILLNHNTIFGRAYLFVDSTGWTVLSVEDKFPHEEKIFTAGETITEEFTLTAEEIKSISNGQSGEYWFCALPSLVVGNEWKILTAVSTKFDTDFTQS